MTIDDSSLAHELNALCVATLPAHLKEENIVSHDFSRKFRREYKLYVNEEFVKILNRLLSPNSHTHTRPHAHSHTCALTCHFCASLKHKDDGQTKFIKLNSLRQDIIIKYWVSIESIHRDQG